MQPALDAGASLDIAQATPAAPGFDTPVAATLPDVAQADVPDQAPATAAPGLFDALPGMAPAAVAHSPAEAAADASQSVAPATDAPRADTGEAPCECSD